MSIMIYNPNSSGGNYEYIIRLSDSLFKNDNKKPFILYPSNADISNRDYVKKRLLPDRLKFIENQLFNKFYFILRSVVNPFILLVEIIMRSPKAVIFNDYDQLTTFLWVPFLLMVKRKKIYSVILHDPDRDAYFPVRRLSEWSMSLFMKAIDFAFYHEVLPSRPYYENNSAQYISIPHGIYEKTNLTFEKALTDEIKSFKGNDLLYGIVGNIREEKNYELVLEALTKAPGKLIIAGSVANSRIDIESLKTKAKHLKVYHRVLWLEKYLSESELHTVIDAVDVILLYYKATFHSQSGILNIIAPYAKRVVVSDTPSALSKLVRSFGLGALIPPDDLNSLSLTMKNFQKMDVNEKAWSKYLSYASWDNAAKIILNKMEISNEY